MRRGAVPFLLGCVVRALWVHSLLLGCGLALCEVLQRLSNPSDPKGPRCKNMGLPHLPGRSVVDGFLEHLPRLWVGEGALQHPRDRLRSQRVRATSHESATGSTRQCARETLLLVATRRPADGRARRVANGTIVTVDAMNCQRDIARRIIDKAGDYLFALKANQQTLYDTNLFA